MKKSAQAIGKHQLNARIKLPLLQRRGGSITLTRSPTGKAGTSRSLHPYGCLKQRWSSILVTDGQQPTVSLEA